MRNLSSLFVAASVLYAGVAFGQTPTPTNAEDEEYYPTYQGQPQGDPNQGYPQGDPNAQPQYADPYAGGQPVQVQAQAGVVAPAVAPQGQFYAYVGVHPVPYEQGNGICPETGAHFHEYAPFDQYLFRESNGYFYFVGDVGDFGYGGQTWTYGSNHPIPAEFGGGYCYIPWAHRHHFAPPQEQMAYYSYANDYYTYTGAYDPYYYDYRDGYWGYYNGYYHTNYYGGRYWTTRPRAIYRPTVIVGRGLYAGGRYVPPPPGFSGRYGATGVRVWGGRYNYTPPRAVVYAPPRRVWTPPPRVITPGYRGPGVGVTVSPGYRGPNVGVTVSPPARVYSPPPSHYAPPPARVYSPGPSHYSPPPARVYSPAPSHYSPPPSTSRPSAPVRVAPAPARRR